MASLDGTKRGTILLTGANSDLRFLGVQTLSKVNMSLGGTAGTSAMLEAAGLSSFLPAQLTLGSAVTITHTAGADASIGLAQITSSGFETPGVVINQGSIAAGLKGGTFFINGGSFDNQGKVTVSNGDVLTVNPSKFTNEGTVNVVTGATLNIGQSFGTQTVWSSTGTLSETNATIKLLGTVSLDNLNSITRSGGTVAVAGVANLGGGTLNVGTGTKLGALVLTGTITNGTVNDADPGVIFSGSAATLNGVKYQGTLDLSPASSRVTVLNGLPLSGLGGVGKATILDTGAGSLLETVGTTTLDNANMSLGGTGFSSATLNIEKGRVL